MRRARDAARGHRNVHEHGTERLSHDFLITMPPGNCAHGLENVESLLVKILRDFNAPLPTAQTLVAAHGPGQNLTGYAREKRSLRRRDFFRGRRPDPLFGALISLQECTVALAVLVLASAAEAAERDGRR